MADDLKPKNPAQLAYIQEYISPEGEARREREERRKKQRDAAARRRGERALAKHKQAQAAARRKANRRLKRRGLRLGGIYEVKTPYGTATALCHYDEYDGAQWLFFGNEVPTEIDGATVVRFIADTGA